MIKAKALKKGDKVAIISLSSGILGEKECEHSIEIATRRLKEFGLEVKIMKHALKGIEFIKNNPDKRAEDLKNAFLDDSIKGIICAIGGVDTYKTLPYLMEDKEFIESVKKNPKIFTGFSDTTTNHLMFYKIGLTTYYGINVLSDLAEMEEEMLPYTKKTFESYFEGNDLIEIKSSDVWYDERKDFSKNAINTKRNMYKEEKGYEVLSGSGIYEGELLGGCIDSLYTILTGNDENKKEICEKYEIFPSKEKWKNKIMFLETSEQCIHPTELEEILLKFESLGVLDEIKGMIVGKPQNGKYYEEYKEVYKKIIKKDTLVLYNVNFGHAFPRTVLGYGLKVIIDTNKKTLKYNENLFSKYGDTSPYPYEDLN